jgi:hypothetical protein
MVTDQNSFSDLANILPNLRYQRADILTDIE